MGPIERRIEILETLCHRRQDTMANLAFEYEVSIGTIKNDINYLSLSYPIETIRGHGGGVKITDGYHLFQKYLKPKQQDLLERVRDHILGEDRSIMDSIISEFALKK